MRKDVLTGAVVALLLLVAEIEAFGFVAGALTSCFGLFLVPGVGLGLVVWGKWREHRGRVQLGVALLVAAAVAFFSAGLVVRAQERESMRRGDRVCEAIEAYRETHGAYPANLQDLMPAFLPELPLSAMGLLRAFPFRYQRTAEGEYRLLFETTVFIACQRGPDGRWWCDD